MPKWNSAGAASKDSTFKKGKEKKNDQVNKITLYEWTHKCKFPVVLFQSAQLKNLSLFLTLLPKVANITEASSTNAVSLKNGNRIMVYKSSLKFKGKYSDHFFHLQK